MYGKISTFDFIFPTLSKSVRLSFIIRIIFFGVTVSEVSAAVLSTLSSDSLLSVSETIFSPSSISCASSTVFQQNSLLAARYKNT